MFPFRLIGTYICIAVQKRNRWDLEANLIYLVSGGWENDARRYYYFKCATSKGKGKGPLKGKGRDNGCVARAIDLHVQFYGEIFEKKKGLIQTVGRFKVERYTEKMEAKLEMKRAEAAAMSEQEAKNGEKRERSLMSRAD